MARPTKTKKELTQVMNDVNEVIEEDINEKEDNTIIIPKLFIPTGSTMLNLALSDKPDGGYAASTMVNLIGDSSSGKSLLAMTSFATCAQDERFDDYSFDYDEPESALAFNLKELFGKKAAKRINLSTNSLTIQEFRTNLFKRLDKDKPFIYVLDSFDALTSDEEIARTAKDDGGGSYKTEKPKIASEIFRQMVRRMKEMNSFLLIVSQTRDNLGFGAAFNPKVRSGGKALKFFASHELWTSMQNQEKKKDLIIGSNVCAKITKNKITGKRREAYFPIYYDIGVDNTTSCINYMIDKKKWTKEKNTIIADEFNARMTFTKLVEHIENNSLESELDILVGNLWNETEDSVKLNRKKRFE